MIENIYTLRLLCVCVLDEALRNVRVCVCMCAFNVSGSPAAPPNTHLTFHCRGNKNNNLQLGKLQMPSESSDTLLSHKNAKMSQTSNFVAATTLSAEFFMLKVTCNLQTAFSKHNTYLVQYLIEQ